MWRNMKIGTKLTIVATLVPAVPLGGGDIRRGDGGEFGSNRSR